MMLFVCEKKIGKKVSHFPHYMKSQLSTNFNLKVTYNPTFSEEDLQWNIFSITYLYDGLIDVSKNTKLRYVRQDFSFFCVD